MLTLFNFFGLVSDFMTSVVYVYENSIIRKVIEILVLYLYSNNPFYVSGILFNYCCE